MLVLTIFTPDCFSKNSLHPYTYSNFKYFFSKYQISQLNTIVYHKYTKLFTRTSCQTETPLIYLVHRVWWTSFASKVNDETNTRSKLNRIWLKQCVLTGTIDQACLNVHFDIGEEFDIIDDIQWRNSMNHGEATARVTNAIAREVTFVRSMTPSNY